MSDMEFTYDEKQIDEFARDVTALQQKIEEQKKQIAALQASLEYETRRAQAAIRERDAALVGQALSALSLDEL